MVLNGTYSVCQEGCLACEKDSTGNPLCKVCDTQNFYRLSSTGRCFKWNIENCEIPSSNPEKLACNLCNPGFFLDQLGNRCSPVPEKFKIPDCKRYHWEYSCNECNEGFYLRDNKCRPISTQIEKCRVYTDANTCSECEDEYFYHVGTKKCEVLTKRDKCLVYSSVECTECVSGHFEVENLASGSSLSPSFLQSLIVYSKNQTSSSALYETKPVNQCVKGTVDFCAKHSSFDECVECKSGYFLSPSKKCESDPIRTVAHCEAYKAANNCSRCTSGYYLEKNVCRKLSEVDGCLEFDPSTEDCLKCDYSKFYLDEGFCGARDKSLNIAFCQEKSNTSDHCVKCIPSFQLTDDKLKCLPHIPHCSDYVKGSSVTDSEYTNVNTVSLRCSSCDDHFYLSPNKMQCIPRDSPGCIEFTANKNDCSECASGYYIKDDACHSYTKDFCKSFEEDKDECKTCFDGFFLKNGDCLKYTARNCLTVESDSNNCASCSPQYYLKADGNSQKHCEPLTARNCKTFSKPSGVLEDSCDSCFQGYAKVGANCVPISLLNCQVQTLEANSCATCKKGYFKEGGTCKAYTVRNCNQYEDTKDECTDCLGFTSSGHKNNPYYLNSDKNCLPYTALNCETKVDDDDKCASCADLTNWYINHQGDCVPSHLKHCTTLKTNTAKDECDTCAHGYKQSGGKCFKLNIPGCVGYTADACSSCANGFYLTQGVCLPYTVSNCKDYVNNKDECDNCLDGFQKISNFCVFVHKDFCSKYDATGACTECVAGYTLNSPNCEALQIGDCVRYKQGENKCLECKIGFTLTNDTTCSSVNYVEGCMKLDPRNSQKCAICHRGYVLDPSNLTCSIASDIPNCIQYEANSGKCEACVPGKIPKSDQSACEDITYSVQNCLKYDLSNGNCQTCALGHFMEGPNKCSTQNISNCLVFKPNENVCLQCKEGHQLKDEICEAVVTIQHCLHYNSDRSACLVCDTDYYPFRQKCEKNIFSKCTMKSRNENKCYACKDNFYLGYEKDCGGDIYSPTDDKCKIFSKKSMKCTVCEKGYYLDSNNTCTSYSISGTDFQYDPSCEGSFAQNAQCGFCPQGNVSFSLLTEALNVNDYTGCDKVDPTTGNCVQCSANFDRSNSNDKTCANAGAAVCAQLKENASAGTTLASNTQCAECTDKTKYYVSSEVCTEKKEINVLELDQTDGSISVCTSQALSVPKDDTLTECAKINTLTSGNYTSNCYLHNENGECITCKKGFEKHSDTVCNDKTAQTNSVTIPFKLNSDSKIAFLTFMDETLPGNTSVAINVTESSSTAALLPGVCSSSNVRLIPNSASGQQNFGIGTNLTELNGAVEFSPSYPKFTCESLGTKFLTTAAEDDTSALDCTYWIKDGNDFKKCLGCNSNYPVFTRTEKTKNGSTFAATTPSDDKFKSVVSKCETIANIDANSTTPNRFNVSKLEKAYQGLNYHTTGLTPMSTFLTYDSCSDGHAIIVFAQLIGNELYPQDITITIDTGIEKLYNIICVSPGAVSNDSSLFANGVTVDINAMKGGVGNCQIHLWKDQSNDTHVQGNVTVQIPDNAADDSRLNCLACQPNYTGFKAVATKYSGSLLISQCESIDNCNTASGTWMNACETCSNNFSWEITDDWDVMFHKCVASASNCLMYKGSNCLLCKKDFFYDSTASSCVSITAFNACDTVGLPPFTFLQKNTNHSEDNALIFSFLVQKIFGGYKEKYCDSCSSDYYMIQRTVNKTVCTNDFQTQLNLGFTSDANCLYYTTNYATCSLCANSFVLDTSNSCIANSGTNETGKRAGCKQVDASNDCSACKDGYISYTYDGKKFCFNETEIKTELFCSKLRTSDGICEICKLGYVPDTTDKYKCKAWTDEDCDRLNRNGTCMKCKNANHFPIHYKLKTPNGDIEYEYKCVDQGSSDFDKFLLTPVYFDFATNTTGVITTMFPDYDFYRTYTDKTAYEAAGLGNFKDKCLKVISEPFLGCSEASQFGMKCARCDSEYLFKESDDSHNECIKTYSGCLRYYPDSLECEICKPDYIKLPESNECITRTYIPTELIPDPTCAGNNKEQIGCDYCPEGNSAIEVKYLEKAGENTNCLESTPDATGYCKLCEAGNDFVANSKTCTTATADPLKCNMLKPGLSANTSLDTNNCIQCNPGYVLSSETCYDLTDLFNLYEASYSSGASISSCENWAVHQTSAASETLYECAKFELAITDIADCKVYKPDGECALCVQGKSGTTSCTGSFTDSYPIFDTDLNLTNTEPTGLTNAILGYSIDDGVFKPIQCAYTHRIRQYSVSNNYEDHKTPAVPKNYSSGDTVDKTVLEISRTYPNITCEQYTSSLEFLVGSNNSLPEIIKNNTTPTLNDCALWRDITIGIKCIRCFDGKVAKIVGIANKYVDGNTSDASGVVDTGNQSHGGIVDSCVDPSGEFENIRRAYQGLGYNHIGTFPWGGYISLDDCNDDKEVFIVIGRLGTNGVYDPIYYDPTNLPITFSSNTICANIDGSDYWSANPPTNKWDMTVENCQINGYHITHNSSTVNKFSGTAGFRCLACRPNYKATSDGDKYVTGCALIDKCANTNNTWMNACSQCDPDYAWTYNSTSKIIDLANCAAINDSENCLVRSETVASECVMCKANYTLQSNGKCITYAALGTKNCDTTAGQYPRNNMSYTATENSMSTLDFISYQYQKMSFGFSPYCASCDTGYSLIKIDNSNDNYCSNSLFLTNWTANPSIGSCEKYNPTNQAECAECATGNVIVTGSYSSSFGGSCASTTSHASTDPLIVNCQSVVDSTDFHCTRCKKGYKFESVGTASNQHKICYKYNDTNMKCARFDFENEKCLVCENNHQFDSFNSTVRCVPFTPSSGTCSQPATDGRCLKCAGTNFYPFHWKLKTPEAGKNYKHYCIDQGRALDDVYFYIVRGFDLRTNQTFSDNSLIPHGKNLRTYSNYTSYDDLDPPSQLNKVSHICLKIKDSTNFTDCTELSQFGYKCSRCSSGKALYNKPHDFNQCSLDCDVIDPLTRECVLCNDSSKYLSADRSNCDSSYTVTNCNYKSPFADACIYCNTGFYLTATQTCTAYSVMENCLNRDYYSDKCVLCADGYVLQNDGTCAMNSFANCTFASPSKWNECMVCDSGYDLSGGKCHPTSTVSSFCKTRNSEGKCESCYTGYSLVNGSCSQTYSPQEIEGCVNYDHHGYACVQCEIGLTLSNGQCRGKDFANCKVFSENNSHCLVCEKGFFMRGIECAPRRIFNCLKYVSNEDKCLSCHPGSYLSHGKCLDYTVGNCKVHNPTKNECITCSDGFFFNLLTRRCEESGVLNCQVKNYATDSCYSCLPQYFLNDEGICLARTVDNCRKFDPYADSCIDCTENFFLVEDTGTEVGGSATRLNSCKPYTIGNCSSFHPREDKCIVCLEGFSLNSDGKCLPRTAFNCASWNEELTECKSCPDGTYLEAKMCNAYTVSNCAAFDEVKNACLTCMNGFYLQDRECLAYSISDCENFESDKDRCNKCKPGFFKRNGKCQPISQNNCATHAEDSNNCSSCETGYYLQNGMCLTYTISCLDYSPSSNQCLSCPDGQFLEIENRKCINYTVDNCATYSLTSNHCETCVDNHYFKGGKCMAYTVTNCNVFHSLFDECITCQEGFYHYKKNCLPYNIINCEKYSPVSDVCLVCEEKHFNLNGNCFPYSAENCGTYDPNRDACVTCKSEMFYKLTIKDDWFQCKAVTKVEDCDVYEEYKDKCYTCEKGYYLDESTNTCHEVPKTVSNCQEFTDAQNCKSCVAPYYLDNNTCVKSDHKIDKCVKYLSNTKCSECEGSNMLSEDSTLCLKITEPSCETYLNPSNCKTCSGNFVINYIDDSNGTIVSGLNGEDLTSRRAICNNSGIDNCTLARRSFPENTCLECKTNYFLASSSSCLPITQQIDNCDKYFSDGVCAQCSNNHVLSQDKTKCLFDMTFLGDNCQSGKFFSEPKCFLCRTGHYFDSDGNCQPCAMKGCAICTEDSSASCRLCDQGYYMNEEMKCVENGTTSSARLAKEIADDGIDRFGAFKESVAKLASFINILFIMVVSKLF